MKLEDIKTGYHLASQGKRKVCVYVGPDKWVSGEEDFFERADDMLKDGWTFERLVPAKEVEKAHEEGWSDHIESCGFVKYSEYWDSSLAKRIAEGLE